MKLSGRHFREEAHLFVNGRRVAGSVALKPQETVIIELTTTPPSGLHLLQVQNPDGLFSNEFIFHVVDNKASADALAHHLGDARGSPSALLPSAIARGDLEAAQRHIAHGAGVNAWAFITARREGIDWLRRHRRETSYLDPEIMELLEQEWQSEVVQPEGSRMDALRECLESLPAESRRLLRLRYFEGHNCEEVARSMGIGLPAIYKGLELFHVEVISPTVP